MRAWLLPKQEGLEAMRLDEVPDPRPGPGEVLVGVHYASLNPADRYLAENQYPARPSFPHVLGRDGVGEVLAIGPGVASHTGGELRLLLSRGTGATKWGTFAEKVVVPAESLAPVPEGWSEAQAAAGPLAYLTALQALTQWGELPPSVVLVTGASGGVGVACLHLGKALGHTLAALSRKPEKAERLKAEGADVVLSPDDPGWSKALREKLGGRKVDLAVDHIGGKLLPQVIESLGMNGKVSLVGRLAGPVPEFNTATLFFRRLRLGGVALTSWSGAEIREGWARVLELLARRGARPVVDRVFPFEQLPAAFRRLAEGPLGKVVLEVRTGRRGV